MNKKDRLQSAYNYLRSKGMVRTQKDLADELSASPSNISRAMNGDELYLTDSLLQRLCSKFNNMFNVEWMLYGTGEMLRDGSNTNNTNIEEVSVATQPQIEKSEDMQSHTKSLQLIEESMKLNKSLVESVKSLVESVAFMVQENSKTSNAVMDSILKLTTLFESMQMDIKESIGTHDDNLKASMTSVGAIGKNLSDKLEMFHEMNNTAIKQSADKIISGCKNIIYHSSVGSSNNNNTPSFM